MVMLQRLIWPVIGWCRAELRRRLHRIGSGVVLIVSGKSVGSPPAAQHRLAVGGMVAQQVVDIFGVQTAIVVGESEKLALCGQQCAIVGA
jgi:hypothetical protein